MSHPAGNLLQLKVAHNLPPLFGNKLKAVIPDNAGPLFRHLLQGYGDYLDYLLSPHIESQFPVDDIASVRIKDANQEN